jgi:D-alanyl-D-alanine carboxypeptidase
MTYAHSMAFYQTSETEPHPIDLASGQFFLAALCGDAQPATRSATTFDPRPHLRG